MRCDDQDIVVTLEDGREVRAPLTDRLRAVSADERADGMVEDRGTALHWEHADEDIGVAHLLGVSEAELYALAGFEHPRD